LSEEECLTVQNRWDVLKSKIGWKDEYYRYLDVLKEMRLGPAHPEKSKEELMEIISSKNDYIKHACKQLLEVLEKVKSLCL